MTTLPRKRKTRRELTLENEQLNERLHEAEERLEAIEKSIFGMSLKNHVNHVRLYYAKLLSTIDNLNKVERNLNALFRHFKLKPEIETEKTVLVEDNEEPETRNVKPETKQS